MTKVQKTSKTARGASRNLMRQSQNREAPKQPLRSRRHSLGMLLGTLRKAFGARLGALGCSWATLGGSLGPLGALRECCWGLFGTPWDSLGFVGTLVGSLVAPLGDLWVAMCLLGVPFGMLWGAFGVILDTFGRLCGHFWRDAAKLRKYMDVLRFPQLKDTRGATKIKP